MQKITLPEMLAAREARAKTQELLLKQYGLPLISFTLNIPGEIKTSPRLQNLFAQGLAAIEQQLALKEIAIVQKLEHHAATGDECLLACAGDAVILKEMMTEIEEKHSLGRLMDIDVLTPAGKKLSRPHPRKCFVCGRMAADCARSRRHTATELTQAIKKLLDMYLR
ncbi:MAG: citrate lyase holo-[acyl-carrier protein] synthase [Selenomonas sp.]|uniref:citrate lyase holo-[acyl-carrier protein] synthase n=1 Tax=Selenomonas sp. TaxID=2053611 RepID=UPI0025DB9BCF|nr:citrate lyase holo-[acyl-carrier protein] synthase [Selenomonas sp.]MCR5758242.1 citrate lyase holo-[acyl-carrier protein] synthase [Selenomonas sp.]